MGTQLYDACQKIEEHIQASGLDVFKTRGAIALETGFLVSLIGPDDPEDPVKLASLKGAAKKVLDLDI